MVPIENEVTTDIMLFPWILLCNKRGLEIFYYKFTSMSTRRYKLVAFVKNGHCKVQTADCGPGVKCRLSVKCRLCAKCRMRTAEWG